MKGGFLRPVIKSRLFIKICCISRVNTHTLKEKLIISQHKPPLISALEASYVVTCHELKGLIRIRRPHYTSTSPLRGTWRPLAAVRVFKINSEVATIMKPEPAGVLDHCDLNLRILKPLLCWTDIIMYTS